VDIMGDYTRGICYVPLRLVACRTRDIGLICVSSLVYPHGTPGGEALPNAALFFARGSR
jgi:hypothetical protein